eukprot:50713-Pyramimonas_sp.AAC.1
MAPPRPILAHRAHGSWPHRQLHRRFQRMGSHGTTALSSAHPSPGSWREGSSGGGSHGASAPTSARPSHASWP